MQRSWLTRAGGGLWAVTGRGPSVARRVLRSSDRLQQPSGGANLSPPRIFSTNPLEKVLIQGRATRIHIIVVRQECDISVSHLYNGALLSRDRRNFLLSLAGVPKWVYVGRLLIVSARTNMSELTYAQGEDRSQVTSFLFRPRTETATVSSQGSRNTQGSGSPTSKPSRRKTTTTMMCCLLVLDSVTSTPQCIRQPRPRVYLKEGTYHTRLFRRPSTNDMKK
jgi:hypothetical protein